MSTIKFGPKGNARLLEFFIRSRIPFNPYTEGFRDDFDFGNCFYNQKMHPY